MKAAYVGTLTPGSTSRMRAEWLRKITPGSDWDWIDTDAILLGASRLAQSLAYRAQVGPGVDAVNQAVAEWARSRQFDLVWVDKAIFLRRDTVSRLKSMARRLVHYTPDTAFHANRSRHFDRTIGLFDLLVTTKSFEVDEYIKRIGADRVQLTTQGFDPDVHFPRTSNGARKKAVALVGLAEPSRVRMVTSLLQRGIPVHLAGRGWNKLVATWRNRPKLVFHGDGVFGDDYAELLSSCWIGAGLLSKRFPELHTTRTFEIPACGAVLATEKNRETESFFTDDEAVFFRDADDLAGKILEMFEETAEPTLEKIAAKGRSRVVSDKRDYPAILSRVLSDERLAP